MDHHLRILRQTDEFEIIEEKNQLEEMKRNLAASDKELLCTNYCREDIMRKNKLKNLVFDYGFS